MVDEINAILLGAPDPAHYLKRTQGQPFIIYGMDDPQRTYLAVDHFRNRSLGVAPTSAAEIGHRVGGMTRKEVLWSRTTACTSTRQISEFHGKHAVVPIRS
ncbi:MULTISPECIES: hypothetical protein [Paraburkholderia]|nr:hypothetical protein [Paraburkholderia dokdonensis]